MTNDIDSRSGRRFFHRMNGFGYGHGFGHGRLGRGEGFFGMGRAAFQPAQYNPFMQALIQAFYMQLLSGPCAPRFCGQRISPRFYGQDVRTEGGPAAQPAPQSEQGVAQNPADVANTQPQDTPPPALESDTPEEAEDLPPLDEEGDQDLPPTDETEGQGAA